eukprot:2060382-Rhodomonas_salina.1
MRASMLRLVVRVVLVQPTCAGAGSILDRREAHASSCAQARVIDNGRKKSLALRNGSHGFLVFGFAGVGCLEPLVRHFFQLPRRRRP